VVPLSVHVPEISRWNFISTVQLPFVPLIGMASRFMLRLTEVMPAGVVPVCVPVMSVNVVELMNVKPLVLLTRVVEVPPPPAPPPTGAAAYCLVS
jgi:hypothetical protein